MAGQRLAGFHGARVVYSSTCSGMGREGNGQPKQYIEQQRKTTCMVRRMRGVMCRDVYSVALAVYLLTPRVTGWGGGDKAGRLLTYPQVTGGADNPTNPALLTYPHCLGCLGC